MKKLLLMLASGLMLLMMFGCSDTPDVTQPDQTPQITLVQRPEFIETRPQDVIDQFTLTSVSAVVLDKKPVSPPPDTYGPDPNPNPAHKWAYIVGIADYEGTANDLEFPDDDAIAMKAFYESQGFTCRMDLNLDATADNITAGLEWLIANAAPGDEVCFNYSGHAGKARKYGSALISADLYYVTHEYVMSYFNAVDCSKKLVAMDACVLGDFFFDVEEGTLMALASTNCFSWDAPDLGHGAWTYYFLEGGGIYTYGEDVANYAEDGMAAWGAQYNINVCPEHWDAYTGGGFDI
jgi:hypothetical protein